MEDYLADTDQKRGERLSRDALRGVSVGIPAVWAMLFLTVVLGTGGFLWFARSVQRSNQQLEGATDRLTLATRAGGVGIFDYDVAKNVLVWDEQMFRLYGITKDHFGGVYETWRNDLHPEDRKHANNELKAALRGEKDIDCEFRVRPGRENASSGCSPAPGRLKGRELSERRSPVRTAAVPLCLLR